MGKNVFHCKRFSIRQDQCAMKVNTDGLLLGAWTPMTAMPQRIVDIGTGTGIIALMLAQRYPDAVIEAIEIDPAAAEQARDNLAASPWADRLQLHALSIQDFLLQTVPNSYDLVVSNPPFFNNSLKSPNPNRNLARHTDSLPLSVLLDAAQYLLHPTGKLALVLPISEAESLFKNRPDWHIYQQTDVAENSERVAHRRLLYVGLLPPPAVCEPQRLDIKQGSTQQHSEAYRQLTQDFHTIF